MTRGELAAVRAVDDRPVVIVEIDQSRVEIANPSGGGCPYYDRGCAVYPVRPGVCRAWGCFRRGTEPYHDAVMLARYRESAGVRRAADRMIADGEAWTRTHP